MEAKQYREFRDWFISRFPTLVSSKPGSIDSTCLEVAQAAYEKGLATQPEPAIPMPSYYVVQVDTRDGAKGEPTFLAFDPSSGGYPWSAPFTMAERFKDVPSAVKCMINNTKYVTKPQLVKVSILTERLDTETALVREEEFEQKLAALKKEYGKN